jgi:sialic acid synthase SpsE
MGASVIEKHLTLYRGADGPDHLTSLEPDQFRDMVSAIRRLEIQLGDGVKRVMPSEAPAVAIAHERAEWRKCVA